MTDRLEISGFCDERFAPVRQTFEENFTERGDVGASFAVTLEGEYVVDLWGGHADAARTRPWQEDTIVNVYSTTKTMTFLVALMLADRGELAFDAPVSRYWPEFAQNGKEAVEVRHFMSHSAGVPGFSRKIVGDELYDWDLVVADLAAQAPWWEPGTASGYHAITQGFLIGEVVRRITGQTIGTFFKKEIAEPLGADFHIGVDPKDFPRIADLLPSAPAESPLEMDGDSITGRVFGTLDLSPEVTSTEGWRRAEIPAANGHGNARSVVRAQTAMANGGSAFGVRLMSETGALRAFEEQTFGPDKVLMRELRFGLGYAFDSPMLPLSPSPRALFWAGAGGSIVVADVESRMCFSYVMNQMKPAIVGDSRGGALSKVLYESFAAS